MLNNDQITRLRSIIGQEGIAVPGLADDLLDHYCCCVEALMSEDLAFEEAVQAAYAQVFPGGIKEIEEDVISVLTPKTTIAMKKALYATGFTSAFLISTGFLFRFMHWPSAMIIMSLGFILLLLVVLPLMIIVITRDYSMLTATDKIRTISGIVSAALITNGFLFKVQHWPSANIQIVLGVFVLNMIFLPLLFYRLYARTTAK